MIGLGSDKNISIITFLKSTIPIRQNISNKIFQGVVLAARLWNGGTPIGGLINHTVGVNIITGEKLLQGIVGKVL